MQNFSRSALALSLLAAAASAQIRLPPLPLQLPGLPLQSAAQNLDPIDAQSLQRLSAVRRLEINRLVRGNRRVLDRDPNGEPVIRNEILALSPSEAAAASARALNFVVAREQ